MKNCLALLGISALIAGCGGKKSGSPAGDGVTTTSIAKTLVPVDKQEEYCTVDFSEDDPISFSINQYINGAKIVSPKDFVTQIKKSFIRSVEAGPISQAYYGYEYKMKAHYKYVPKKEGYLEIEEETEEETEKKLLDVCASNESYNRFTIEDAGLNISYTITKTYDSIKEANPDINLPQISVNVAPKIYYNYRVEGGPSAKYNKVGYEADNANYNPTKKEITFLPQSDQYQQKKGDIPFWEIPMVGSHEYGHHVFNTIVMKDELPEIAENIHPKFCFHNITTMKNKRLNTDDDKETEEEPEKRNNTAEFALRSMNEGFADLIAFYALDKSERMLTKVECFEKNREVGFSSFTDRTKKIFTDKALKLINSEREAKSDHKCSTPDYQEIHDVGAVFAYNVNQLISRVTEDKSIKLKIILSWANNFNKQKLDLTELKAGEFMFAALESMYATALREAGLASSSTDCSAMNNVFTGNHGYKCRYLK